MTARPEMAGQVPEVGEGLWSRGGGVQSDVVIKKCGMHVLTRQVKIHREGEDKGCPRKAHDQRGNPENDARDWAYPLGVTGQAQHTAQHSARHTSGLKCPQTVGAAEVTDEADPT